MAEPDTDLADAIRGILESSGNAHITELEKKKPIKKVRPVRQPITGSSDEESDVEQSNRPLTKSEEFKMKQLQRLGGQERRKPDRIAERSEESKLARIATRGVVKLFNAVKEHQGSMNESDFDKMSKKRKVEKDLSNLKQKFVTKLEKPVSAEKGTEKRWKVLQDDFLMKSDLKSWDQESSSDEN